MPFLLLIIGIVLIAINIRTIKADNKDNHSFETILSNRQENITSLEVEMGAIRKDMAETILELQGEIEDLKGIIKNYNIYNNVDKVIEDDNIVIKSKEKHKNININGDSNASFKDKNEKVIKLIEEGLSEDDICTTLNIGKGELQLIKKLLKN
ncbi:DUF6115 domain-containing protein [Clostridium hydrogeniformans]|uniref:DUF6115 domain-containing protein n=1 Tax=Clostridium hydrogeniformans TaxID=349933 RepID=UPI00054D315A|nr:hypothetical protein [Clostridium hydrogeniformans]